MEEKSSYLSFFKLKFLYLGVLILIVSYILFYFQKNERWSITLLILGGFSIRLFIILLNNHLNLWDEQFHALVAKNMIENPFKPVLFGNPVLPFDFTNWASNHIWLHKQPLFLWQMALSIKIFGTNVFAIRLPSAVISTILIYFVYRIGKISINRQVGYYAAFFLATSYFLLELVAGVIHTDHNDVAFIFYVIASIWAWTEYESSQGRIKILFLVLTGLFAGFAVLTKWLAGLLVFSGWGISIISDKDRRKDKTHYFHLILSAFITLVVFLPWQIYILQAFPVESHFEYSLNSRHFFDPVEGHGGNFWFHINALNEIYGLSKYWIIAFIIIFFKIFQKGSFKTAFLTFIIVVYLFFSLAATKMIAFPFIVSFISYCSATTRLIGFPSRAN